MKLHSDFHDYYDTAVGFGIDENVHYNRFTRTIEKNLNLKLDFPPYYYGNSLLLGFCGEIYPLIKVIDYDEKDKPKAVYYTFSYEEYFVRIMKIERVVEQIKNELWWLGRKQTEKEIKKQLTKRVTKEKLNGFLPIGESRTSDCF